MIGSTLIKLRNKVKTEGCTLNMLMLIKLKIMKGVTFIYTCLFRLNSRSFHVGFHIVHHPTFLNTFLIPHMHEKWTMMDELHLLWIKCGCSCMNFIHEWWCWQQFSWTSIIELSKVACEVFNELLWNVIYDTSMHQKTP
jgi:hypothetical protein